MILLENSTSCVEEKTGVYILVIVTCDGRSYEFSSPCAGHSEQHEDLLGWLEVCQRSQFKTLRFLVKCEEDCDDDYARSTLDVQVLKAELQAAHDGRKRAEESVKRMTVSYNEAVGEIMQLRKDLVEALTKQVDTPGVSEILAKATALPVAARRTEAFRLLPGAHEPSVPVLPSCVEEEEEQEEATLEPPPAVVSPAVPEYLTLTEQPRPVFSGGGGSVRIWTGTWNTGADDPFVMVPKDEAEIAMASFVPNGYDIYVLGLQEGIEDTVFDTVAHRLASHGIKRLRLVNGTFFQPYSGIGPMQDFDRVFGRGDGSFISPKYTGMAIYVSDRIWDNVRLLRAQCYSFGVSEGSKGGVGAALRVFDTTIVFVNCHLAAHKIDGRRAQYCSLIEELGRSLGNRFFQLHEQFHHVVWMGDLNYRLVNVKAEDACDMIESGQLKKLHNNHDSLEKDLRDCTIFDGYSEASKVPNFFPTYKKFEKRPQPTEWTKSGWSKDVYRIAYKVPFYKGGQIKTRVPGWCDRILWRTVADRDGTLYPEPLTDNPPVKPPRYGGFGLVHNYQAINDGACMVISDHSPVFCTFVLKVNRGESKAVEATAAPRPAAKPVGGCFRLWNIRIMRGESKEVPKRVRALFPAPFEDLTSESKMVKGDRPLLKSSSGIRLVLRWKGVRDVRDLHMILKVRLNKDSFGHCVFLIGDVMSGTTARTGLDGTTKNSVVLPLQKNGLAMMIGSQLVHVCFDIELQPME